MLCLKIETKFMILTQAQLQGIQESQLDTGPQQDKLHTVSILRVVPLTDTLDHLKDCGKITEKISLYCMSLRKCCT